MFVCFSNDLSLHRAAINGKSKFLLFSRNEQMSSETLPLCVADSAFPFVVDRLERRVGSFNVGAEIFSSVRYSDCEVDILSGRQISFFCEHKDCGDHY